MQISASHNPVEDNGIKFFGSNGLKLSDAKEEEIEELIDTKQDMLPRPSAEGLGTVTDFRDGSNKYIQFLENTIPEDLSGIKVVIDGANGAASAFISRLFADLDVDFTTISTHLNGSTSTTTAGPPTLPACKKKLSSKVPNWAWPLTGMPTAASRLTKTAMKSTATTSCT